MMQYKSLAENTKEIRLLKFKKMYLAGKRNFCLIDLSEINLSQENLREIDLRGSDLSGSYLDKIDLRGANLRYSNLFGSDLTAADLRGANLEDTNLCWTNLALALYDEKTKFPDGFLPRKHQMIYKPLHKEILLNKI
ncbi:MAG: pentapeptide repeat-containing protein [Prochloraceae cyanobacterium]